MAKWKEPTGTELTAQALRVDPRVRMKEIRAEVAGYLKGVNPKGFSHLGDLPESMEDARRVIVATQDLLEIERERHRKATAHICELVHLLDLNEEDSINTMMYVAQLQAEIRGLNQRCEAQEKHAYHMRDDLRVTEQQRDAVLTTMKLLNVQPAREATPMSVVMGHSNKDRF